MPKVTFSRPDEDLLVSAKMPTPAKVGSIQAWLVTARKHVPSIPKWRVKTELVTESTIIFELTDGTHTCAVVIDRNYPYMLPR